MFLLLELKVLFFLGISGSVFSCGNLFDREYQELIVDYVNWRKIQHLIILDESLKSKDCQDKRFTQSALSFFYKNNIYASIQTSLNTSIPIFNKVDYKIGLVSFLTDITNKGDNLEYQANVTSTYGENIKWLLIVANTKTTLSTRRNIFEILKNSSLDLSSDLVIAVNLVDTNQAHQQAKKFNSTENKTEIGESNSKVKKDNVLKKFLPFFGNYSEREPFLLEKSCGGYNGFENNSYCLLQIYKIRNDFNTSLVVNPLGFWNNKHGTEKLGSFISETQNMEGFPLKFGIKNSTQDALVSDAESMEDVTDIVNLQEIIGYIVAFLNSGTNYSTFPILGFKDTTGVWSDLLGAVFSQTVDVGVDSVIETSERVADFSFSHNIMESMRNIYIKPEESHRLRNVFLAPFGPKLLFCVLGTGCLLSVVMTIYGNILRKYKPAPRGTYFGIIDSVLWSVAIFSMQGSIFKPKSYSGNIIVVVSLLLALIIYNSYAAFITSILSVKLTNIRTVDDLLESDYDIGYTKNSQDEIYLRSMNLTQLKQIYLRGYLHNNINNITEGLLKATEGNYGFFATRHKARKEMQNINSYKCKYDIDELPIAATKYSVAFPMSKKSPFKRLINLSIIKMYETGVFSYIQNQIEPNMPQCDHFSIYQSAKLNDVISAFFLLIIGYVFGITIVILECILWKRKKICGNIKKNAAKIVANNKQPIPYQN